jgi:hypothetical protein
LDEFVGRIGNPSYISSRTERQAPLDETRRQIGFGVGIPLLAVAFQFVALLAAAQVRHIGRHQGVFSAQQPGGFGKAVGGDAQFVGLGVRRLALQGRGQQRLQLLEIGR